MKYLGSKRRIAKEILAIMEPLRGERVWVEPFVGGGNLIDKVKGRRIGADVNPATINALKCILDRAQDLPKNNKEFTKDDYENLRNGGDVWFKDFALFCYAFTGRYKGIWAKNNDGQDYVKNSYNSAIRQQSNLQGVELLCCSYEELKIPNESLIYCDPPYFKTNGYNGTEKFNHEIFWQWCELNVNEGHIVFVSELTGGGNFIPVWQKGISALNTYKGEYKKMQEKLFIHKDQLHLIKNYTLFK